MFGTDLLMYVILTSGFFSECFSENIDFSFSELLFRFDRALYVTFRTKNKMIHTLISQLVSGVLGFGKKRPIFSYFRVCVDF